MFAESLSAFAKVKSKVGEKVEASEYNSEDYRNNAQVLEIMSDESCKVEWIPRPHRGRIRGSQTDLFWKEGY